MTKIEVHRLALQLSESDRLTLARDLWASVDDPNAHSDSLPLPEWQKELLDQRLEASQDDPGKTWDEVKAQIWPTSS